MSDLNYIECFNDDCKYWSNGKCKYYITGNCVEIVHIKGIPTCNSFEAQQLKPRESTDTSKEIACNYSKDAETLAKICEIQTNQFVDSYIKNFDSHFDISKIGFKKASRKPNIHELKILPEYFNEVQSHNKQFEQRKDELIIHIMHGYDTIQAPNGDVCFGCYDPKTKEIYVADDIPKEALFHTIAHEYKHYLQDIEGKEFSEEEAEEYADSIFNCDTVVNGSK